MKTGSNLLAAVFLISMIFLINGCKKATMPTLKTSEISGITINTAISGGEITSDGGDDITEKGVCWNTSTEPTIADSRSKDGKGTATFTSTVINLQPATTYAVRAYATNSAGTAYGEEFTFNTKIADVDGNQYFVVKIGSNWWMAENLKTTKYNDNTGIPIVTDNTAWIGLSNPAYCWYNNDEAYYKPLYGALYNWYAASNSKLCPTGWHVPTDADFNAMELSLGIPPAQIDTWGWRGTDQGKQLKNTTGWSTNENGTNTSGFAALPGGYRNYQSGGFFGNDMLSYWWSSTDDSANGQPEVAWYRRLDGDNDGVYKATTDKRAGKYIRCVKD